MHWCSKSWGLGTNSSQSVLIYYHFFPRADLISVCSSCSWMWRSHHWSGFWTNSVSWISCSIRQQPPLYLDYRGWYRQDDQVNMEHAGITCYTKPAFNSIILVLQWEKLRTWLNNYRQSDYWRIQTKIKWTSVFLSLYAC